MSEPAPAIGSGWSLGQYRVFRVLLGAYVAVHFLHLAPWAVEVFSHAGVLPLARDSPLMGLLPNPLVWSDAPWSVVTLVLSGALAGLGLMLGRFDRIAAVWAVLVLAWLYARNPLIANPSLPVVGWMLLFHAMLPPARSLEQRVAWRMPSRAFVAAWILLAVAYSYSGYTKLDSPSWIAGEAVSFVLQNPLARDHALREMLLDLPEVLAVLTWGILWVELLFAPLALLRPLRPVLWGVMLLAQCGFLVFLDFADLTLPMFLIHALTFDPRWCPGRRGEAVLYYDGDCGLCHSLVHFAAAEDVRARLRFAPLQGERARRAGLQRFVAGAVEDSVVLVDGHGRTMTQSDAVIGVLLRLGGLWWLLGHTLTWIPKRLRDAGYRGFGRYRHRLARRTASLCPLLPASLRGRWLA